jgi:glycosyltransferase involved in cell wall biosynthesis
MSAPGDAAPPGGPVAPAAAGRRALIALHDPLLGGAAVAVLRCVPLLEARGWRLAFWVPGPGPAREWLRDRGAEVTGEGRPVASSLRGLREPPGLRRRLAATPGYLRHFAEALRAASPDVVHANSLYSFAEALTSRSRGYPTVLHLHDMAPAGRKRAVASWLSRRRVDQAIAASRACADSYRQRGWTPEVVYESAPVPRQAASIREAPRPFVVGTIGVIAPRKGSDIFVAAAARVRERTDGVAFQMIGAATDPLERGWGAGVLADARRLGVEHQSEADVEASLRTWDAFVLPSRTDPCPVAMLEAMALGLPVIGARRDGIPEQVAPGCGLLVEPENPAALATAILAVAELPADRRREMGAAARARVAAEFDVERQARGIEAAWERGIEAAARGRRRPGRGP